MSCHCLERLFLPILLDLDYIDFVKKGKNDKLLLGVVGHEHGLRRFCSLRSKLLAFLLVFFLFHVAIGFHDLPDAHVLSLIEAHVVMLQLVLLFVRLLILVKVDALNRGNPLLFRVLPLLVGQGSEPSLVPVALLFEHAIQQLVVLEGLSYDFLVLMDAFSDFVQGVRVIVQQVLGPFEPLCGVHLVNQVTSFATKHRNVRLFVV